MGVFRTYAFHSLQLQHLQPQLSIASAFFSFPQLSQLPSAFFSFLQPQLSTTSAFLSLSFLGLLLQHLQCLKNLLDPNQLNQFF